MQKAPGEPGAFCVIRYTIKNRYIFVYFVRAFFTLDHPE